MKLTTSQSVFDTTSSKSRSKLDISFESPSPMRKVRKAVYIKNPLIKKLRKRNNNNKTVVTPALASAVVKKFIMPIFSGEMQYHISRSRSTLFNSRPVESIKPALKLSTHIQDMLENSKTLLQILKEKLKKTLELTEKGYVELNSMKTKFSDIQSLVSTTDCSLMSFRICAKKDKLMTPFRYYERLDLEKKYSGELAIRGRFLSQIENLNNHSAALKINNHKEYHNQWMLLMDSANVGERLKGYYDAIFHICFPVNLESKFKAVQDFCTKNSGDTLSHESNQLDYAKKELPKVIHLLKGSTSTFLKRNSLVSEIKKMKVAIISSVQSLDQTIYNSEIEGSLLLKSKNYMNRKFQNFTDEYMKIKSKLEKITDNNKKSNEKIVEKLCGTCGKLFFEHENYNWSCRTHISTWSGKMYWCCGKTFKKSLGCKLQKHFCKQGILTIDDNDSAFAITFCSTCRKQGHLPKECEYDPNTTKGPPQTQSLSPSRIPINKVMEVFKKKQKKYKIVKHNQSVNDLKESLSKVKPIKAKRVRLNRGLLDTSTPTTPSLPGSSPLFEHFPLISRRRGSKK